MISNDYKMITNDTQYPSVFMQYALLKNTCTAQKALVFLMNTVPQNISQSIRYTDVSVGHVGLKK